MIKFSVVVPVYNVENYLNRCLKSIQMQTYKDFEVIIVNDGSTDGCEKIIHYYAENDSRFKVISQANQGLAVARNNGLSLATGEFVLFVDSDDFIDIQTCAKLYEIINSHNVDMIIFDYFEMNEKIYKKIDGYSNDINRVSSLAFPTAAWNKLYRRKILEERKELFMKNVYYEDFSIVPFLIANTSEIFYFGEPLYYYDISRIDNIMKEKSKRNCEILSVSKRLISLFKESKIFLQYEKDLLVIILPRLIDCSIKNRLVSSNNESIQFHQECIEFLNKTFTNWRDCKEAFSYLSESKFLTIARYLLSYNFIFCIYSIANPSVLVRQNMK